jgi:hypothetical protein
MTTTELVPKLNREQYQLLLYMEQYFWRGGGLPTHAQMELEGTNITEDFYFECWNNKRFVDGLRARGLPEHLLVTDSGADALNGKVLTEQQMTVANILMDTLDKRSRIKKLTELGVSTQEYSSWLKDPVYRNYCLERAESLLHENQSIAHMALIERVHQGDLGAIKYFNALTNRYAEKQSADVQVNVNNNYGSDTVIQIVEIIQTHVKDPETLQLIANDILALQGGVGSTPPQAAFTSPIPFRRGSQQIKGEVTA